MDLLPEHLKLTHLEQVSQVEDGLDLRILLYFLGEKTFAENKVGMREIGKRLQKDLKIEHEILLGTNSWSITCTTTAILVWVGLNW